MDLLTFIQAKNDLSITYWKIKLTREQIEKERPNAKEYIEGAKDSEQRLKQVLDFMYSLEAYITQLEKSNFKANYHLMQALEEIKQLKINSKFDGIENEL